MIGDRAGLDEGVQRSLQEAGTYHVIAISGGNIAILAGLLLGAFRPKDGWGLAVGATGVNPNIAGAQALANALVTAYKRMPDAAEEALVEIDIETGQINVIA